jgi:hypothetical protein
VTAPFRLDLLTCSAGLALALCWAMPATAERRIDRGERWEFVNGDDGPKFGYVLPGSRNFEIFSFGCEPRKKRITARAAVGERRPASGRASVTLSAGGKSATLAGSVPGEDYDGVYSLQAVVPPTHPVFEVLATGERVRYSGPAGADVLSAKGLKAAVARFLSACR